MWHLPGLYGHFEACGVTADLYATSWFVTLLSDGGMLPDGEVREAGSIQRRNFRYEPTAIFCDNNGPERVEEDV